MIKALIVILIILLVIMGIGIWNSPAKSQATFLYMKTCGPSVEMTKTLNTKYGEILMINGLLSGRGGNMRMFSNIKTGTWTIAIEGMKGAKLLCIIASGIELKLEIEGKPI